MQKQEQGHQLCRIDVQQFNQNSQFVTIKVVGSIKTIFKHQKYIIQVYVYRKLVIRCFKRYNDFEALYELIKMKYKNQDLGEFPSKYQIIGKQETRKQYFQKFLTSMIKGHQDNRRLISIIYLFLAKDIKYEKDSNLSQRSNQRKLSFQSEEEIFNAEGVAVIGSGTKNSNKKNSTTTSPQIESSNQKKKQTLAQQFIINTPQKMSFEQTKIQSIQPKKHKLSYDMPSITKISPNFLNNNNNNNNMIINKQIKNKSNRKFSNDGQSFSDIYIQNKKKTVNEFEIKFEKQDQWRKRYLKIQGSSLLIYKNKSDNNFRTKMELYRIKVQYLRRNQNLFEHFCQKMQFNSLDFLHKQDPTILSLYHQYDNQKVLIRKTVPLQTDQINQKQYIRQQLARLKKQIEVASQHLFALRQNYQGVFNPISKLFIILHKIKLDWKKVSQDQTILLKIKTSSFSYQSRKMLYRDQIIIKQGFHIPISNTFQDIIIHCILVKEEGWIRQQSQQRVMGQYKIAMSDLLTQFQSHIKLQVQMQSQQKNKQSKTWIDLSVDNYSHISSVYSDSFGNQEDGKAKTTLGVDDFTELVITVDRVLRVIGYVALFIQAFWRNVYLFKYPRMGYTFFTFLLLSQLFVDSDKVIYVIILGLMMIIFYNNKRAKIYADEILEKWIYIQHPSFKHPQILGKNEVSFLKWSHHLKYIGQDYQIKSFNESNQLNKIQKKPDAKRLLFQFTRYGTIFQVRQQQQSLLEKFKQIRAIISIIKRYISLIVNIVQKLTSLLTWVDYRRTLFILFLLFILSGIANTFLIRGIVTLFCIHRLVKGKQFYKSKHYKNNRRFAIYGMRYIINKCYPNLLVKDKQNKELKELPAGMKLKDATQDDVFKSIATIALPIQDQKQQKRLKVQLQEIIGVYFDVQGQAIKHKKQKFLVQRLIDMIQTCQSRLKLKWIPGKQGISNQFQELKEITKEVPVIDVWLQSLVFNFVLNIPSKLYMTFHRKKTI